MTEELKKPLLLVFAISEIKKELIDIPTPFLFVVLNHLIGCFISTLNSFKYMLCLTAQI